MRADQEKDRKREEERRAREAEEAREREKLDAQEMEIQRIRMEKELTIRKIPFEPEPSNPNACHLQIKLRERTVQRRFLSTDTIQVRFYFIVISTYLNFYLHIIFKVATRSLLITFLR